MAEITGVPPWVHDSIRATRGSLAGKGVHAEPSTLLLRLLKRTLAIQQVQAEMARVEDELIAEQRRANAERAEQLRAEAARLEGK